MQTKQATHTPGPWTTPHDDSPYWAQAAAGDVCIPVSSESGAIAEIRWQRKEHRANARLIAAAPELLEALEYLLAHRTTAEVDSDEAQRVQLAIMKSQAAIAKATG